MNNIQLFDINEDIISQLMPIEQACHSHPWSEKLFKSCVGGRYFGEYLTIDNIIYGFYVGEYIAGDATLMDICVHPDSQGRGFGKHLLNAYNNKAVHLGAEQTFLEVRASNISAQMLYINDGYIEVSRRTGYYLKEVGYEDAIVMKRSYAN